MSAVTVDAGVDDRVDDRGDLVDDLDEQLREAVRREGVDPQRDVAVVRRIAESLVRDHDERSLTGVVQPVSDPVAVVGELVARVAGFGSLQAYLDDPAIEEIWINDPSRVFVARNGRHELTNLILTAAQVEELVERMLKSSGRRIDLSQPFVDAMLPEGHRLHVVLEGISRGFSAVNIRKFVLRAARLADLVELGSLTSQAAAFLEASVRAGLNILVAGGTQAGKTTMLNCLAAAIPGGERVISAEEVFELRFPHPDWVPLQTRQAGLEGTGRIVLRDLVRESLRMRPSRIIVGEVRSEECLDLLLALNAGLPGMCTLHANSAREALVKMCTLPLLAGDDRARGLSVNLHAAHVGGQRRPPPNDGCRYASSSRSTVEAGYVSLSDVTADALGGRRRTRRRASRDRGGIDHVSSRPAPAAPGRSVGPDRHGRHARPDGRLSEF